MLTNASEPVRTRDSFKRIDKEINASRNAHSASRPYRLADAENFDAARTSGRRFRLKASSFAPLPAIGLM